MSKEVIKLSATWCGPCKQYAPIFDGVVDDMVAAGWKVSSLDVDNDDGKEIATKFGVRGVPATIILNGDDEAIVKSGSISEDNLRDLVGLD